MPPQLAAGVTQGDCLQRLLGVRGIRLAILRYLSAAETLQLRRLCTAGAAWVADALLATTTLTLGELPRTIPPGALLGLLQHLGAPLRTLRLDWSGAASPVTDDALCPLPHGAWPGLEALSLRGCGGGAGWGLHDAGLLALAGACSTRLTSLDLSDCCGIASLGPVLSDLALRTLGLRGVSCLDNFAIEALATSSGDSLENLDLSYTGICDGDIAALGRCRALQALQLSGCTRLTDFAVEGVLRAMGKGLTALHLRGCEQLGDRTCEAVARHCPDLTALSVSGCAGVTDSGLEPLGRALALQELGVAGLAFVSNVTMGSVASHGTLRALDAARCTRLSDEGLRVLFAQPEGGESAMRSLDLSGCVSVSPRGMASLAAGLVVLALAGTTLADSVVAEAVAGCHTTLESLDVRRCERVAEATAAAVGCCAALRVLQVDECRRLDDRSLSLIAAGCTQLQTLTCSGCGCAEAGLTAVAARCNGLRELSMAGTLVNDRVIDALAVARLPLQKLNVRQCPAISTAPLLRLCTARAAWLQEIAVSHSAVLDVDALEVALPPHVGVMTDPTSEDLM